MRAQADRLAQWAARHQAWAGGFVTWEDFGPCFEASFDASKKTVRRKPGAELIQALRPGMRAQAPQDRRGGFCCDVEVVGRTDAAASRLSLGHHDGQPRALGGGRWRFDIPNAALDWTACTLALRHGGSRELQTKSLCLHGFVQRLGVRDGWGKQDLICKPCRP